MKRKMIPVPPKFLVVALGIVSFISLLGILLGTYGRFSIESGNVIYRIKCSFPQDKKLQASNLFDQLKGTDLDPELISTTDYSTENRGFIAVLNYEGKDRVFLAESTKKVLVANNFKGEIFTSETNPDVVKIRVGDIFQKESEAQSFSQKVFDAARVKFPVEPYKVITGEQKIFIVALKTKDPFIAEDYKQMLQEKGFSPEITTEKL